MSAYRMDHGHYAWSPIVGRERLTWPNGARIAVAFVVSLGHYEADPPPGAFDPPTHRSPLRIMPPPDYPTVTHREYGHRVGIFRLFELFDAHAIRATAAIDAFTAQGYPRLVTECRRRGWEVIAHGVSQRRAITAEMSEADERAYIRLALDAVASVAGTMPRGWLSPEQSESTRTPSLLAEAGVDYVCDWANDDQPYLIGQTDRPLVSLPLMQDISDVDLHWNRRVTMARWAAVVCEAFDTLYRESPDGGRLFMLPLHPWCIGQPFRLIYLQQVLAHIRKHDEVWAATGAEISAWCRRLSHDH
ncbi:MAG TPA: polysaccharide deacetylase family protein [Candidatus Methylomirabilis sp.]|nr:polysaccharide deacetylase family protein [Candidatus Methylomirabilis sp.]